MRNKKVYSKLAIWLTSGMLIALPTPVVWGAPIVAAPQQSQTLAVTSVTPANGASTVRPDAPIQLVFDATAPSFTRIQNSLQSGNYQLTLNGQSVTATYDASTYTLTLDPVMLQRYTTYSVLLQLSNAGGNGNGKGPGNGKGGGKGNGGGGNSNSSYTFSFTTGSALHEATHLQAQLEQSSALVTNGGKLDVDVTDDYGLPATNAKVQVSGNSSSFTAPVLDLTSSSNGHGVIVLNDTVKESVNWTATSTDNSFHDAVDTQVASGAIQYLAGPPDHLTIAASSPLGVAQSEHVTGTVYDVYNNLVEDTTTISATASGGNVTSAQQTQSGAYDFTFTAPTKVQDVTITATSGSANGTVTVHLLPDQAANVALQPQTATSKAGATDPVDVLVTDQYGNPIPNSKLTVTASGSAQVPSTVTTDSTGHATIPVQDTKVESVTITATTDNGVKGTAQVDVVAADPAKLSVQADRTILTADGQSVANATVSVVDAYGNPVANETIQLTSSSQAQFPATVTTDANGQATFTVRDAKAESISIQLATNNAVQAELNLQSVQPVGAGNLVIWKPTPQADGSVLITGKIVDEKGQNVSGVLVPLTVSGGTVSDVTPITAQDGTFQFTLQPDASGNTSVAVTTADNKPTLYVKHAVDQTWTDLGIQVQAGKIVHIFAADGAVEVGGTPAISVADNSFTAGATGELFLQSGATTAPYAMLNVEDASEHFAPDFTIAAAQTTLTADGKTTVTLKGHLYEVTKPVFADVVTAPVVNTNVSLSLPNGDGTLSQTSVSTDQDGTFTATYTAGTTPGTVEIDAAANNQTASTTVTLQSAIPNAPTGVSSETGSNQFTLSWDAEAGATSYNVYVNGKKVNTSPITGTSYVVTGVMPGTPYTYSVTAVNDAGESAPATGTTVTTGATNTFMDNLIPQMTSDTAPLGISSASECEGDNGGTYPAYKAFDRTLGNAWQTTYDIVTGWLAYDFQEPTVVTQYTLTMGTQYTFSPTEAPKNWTFEGLNGDKWEVLDTQTNVTNWSLAVPRTFTFTNTKAYTKYRLNVTANNGGHHLKVGEMTMGGYYSVPFAPSGVYNSKNADSTVTLSWQPRLGVDSYNVYQDGVKVNDAPITTTSYTVTGLTNGVVHHYTVSAVNGAGESPQTDALLGMAYNQNLIATMTSDTAPLGISSASNVQCDNAGTFPSYLAFDKSISTGWQTTYDVTTGWLQYDFQTGAVVKEYTLTLGTYYAVAPQNAPKDWTFEGWDGTQWVILDEHKNVTDWVLGTTRYYTIPNETAYTKYRLNVTANNGEHRLKVGEMELAGYYDKPVAPSGLNNPSNGDSQVTLNWKPIIGVTGYNVYQDGVKVNDTPIITTTYTVTGLTNGVVHHYSVSALNDRGESPKSNELIAMPYNQNLITTMTSDTAPLGIASASDEQADNAGTFPAYKAFDKSISTGWQTNYGVSTGWLQYDFQKGAVVKEYTLTLGNYYAVAPQEAPKNWTFEGWDGTQWVILDTQTNVTNWVLGKTRYFTIPNETSYTKYRLNVSANNGNPRLKVGEMEMAGFFNTSPSI